MRVRTLRRTCVLATPGPPHAHGPLCTVSVRLKTVNSHRAQRGQCPSAKRLQTSPFREMGRNRKPAGCRSTAVCTLEFCAWCFIITPSWRLEVTRHTHTHTHTECAQRRQATRTGSVEVFLTCQTPETNPRVASDPIGSSHSVPGDRKFHFDLLCLAARRRRPHSQLTWAARICLLAPANQVSSSQRQNLLPPACRR